MKLRILLLFLSAFACVRSTWAAQAIKDLTLSGASNSLVSSATFTLAGTVNFTGASTFTVSPDFQADLSIGNSVSVRFTESSSGNAVSLFRPTSVTADRTVRLPDASGTLALVSGALGTPSSLTLTNATGLPVAGGGTGVASLTAYAPIFGGTTGTGAVQSGTVGTSGQVLTSNGAGALPTFQTPAAGGVTSIATTSPISGGTITSTGTISLLTNVDFAFTLAQSLTLPLAANTAGTGWLLTNTTAATSGNQRYSPALRMTGQGWKTNATAASQTVYFDQYVVPVQGTTNPSANWILASNINGSAGSGLQFTSGGVLSGLAGGNVSTAGTWIFSGVINPSNTVNENSGKWILATTGNFTTVSGALVGFSSSATNAFAGYDTAWSRGNAGQMLAGTGAAESAAGEVVASKFRTVSKSGPFWSSGTGTPEAAVTAPVGSLFTRTDGGAGTTLYVKESGAGNTGWVAK